MNRQCYRLVFNTAKGLLVVTSEVAARHGKGDTLTSGPGVRSAAPSPGALGSLKPLYLAVLTAMGLVGIELVAMPSAQAQILPDRQSPAAQRPHVVNSANGTPQVNIQTPNARGVSRNAYRQFDVGAKGAILNNSRHATPTQTGGWVQGNPHLAGAEARVIVNEVNSRDPSRLQGQVEVAGQRAEVIVANPVGIQVDGAGFINASGVTLTTGTPEYRDGTLTGYRVEEGTIQVAGAGLDTRDSDYTAILARAVEVQGAVVANDLDVVAGANQVSADRQDVTPVAGQGDAPEVAVDVAHLGGMYAGEIHLLATEDGVGVRNAGELAALGVGEGGDLVLSADGRITNRGQLASQGELRVTSGHGVDNQGLVRAAEAIEVTSEGDITNRGEGTIIGGGDVTLQASGEQSRIRSERDALLAAGVQADGRLGEQGDLTLEGEAIHVHGENLAVGGFYAQADTLSLRDSRTQAGQVEVASRDSDLDARGATLMADTRLAVATPGTLRSDEARVGAERLGLDAQTLSNVGGEIVQSGERTLALELDTLDNRGGRLASNGALEITVDGALTNEGGEIATGDTLTVEVPDELDNTRGQLLADAIDVTAGALNNTGGTIGAAREGLTIATDALDNTAGRLEAAGDLILDIAGGLTNDGGEIVQAGQAGAGKLDVSAIRVDGRAGLILGQGALRVRAKDLDLDDATTQAEQLRLEAERLSHRGGELLHLGDDTSLALRISESLDNSMGLIAGNGDLVLQTDALINHEGSIQAAGYVALDVTTLNNLAGEIVSTGAIDLAARDAFDNSQGRLLAEAIAIATTRLANAGGTIGAAQEGLTITTDALDNSQGRLEAGGDLTLVSNDTLSNEGGEILQAGEGELDMSTTLVTGRDGLIISQGTLRMRAEDLDLDGATTQAERISLKSDRLSHREGELLQLGTDVPLILSVAQALDNSEGLIAGNADLDLTAGELSNRAGIVQVTGEAYLALGGLDNQAGEIITGEALALTVDGALDNTLGSVLAGQALDVQADTLRNAQGTIASAAESLNVFITGAIDNRDGTLESGGDLDLRSQNLDNRGGTLIGDRVTLTTAGQRLDNVAGLIAARDTLDLVTGRLDNTGGTLQAGGDATLDTHGQVLLNAEGGAILANDRLTLASGDLDNRSGMIGGDTLRLAAGAISNGVGGALLSEGDLTLAATHFDNQRGELQALGDLTLEVGETLDNRRGLVRAGKALALEARQLDNRQTQASEHGIEGQDVDITVAGLDNRQGALRADRRLAVKASEGVTNRDGLISSLDTLILKSDDLDNHDGTLIANRRLDLTTARLTGDGRVLSLGDLALHLASDFTLGEGGELAAAGDLTLTTPGTLINRVTLRAGDTLDLEAGAIVNAASGELAGATTRLSAERLTNRGLIDGLTTDIDTTTLDNLGTGRLYGDRLGIQAGTLTNAPEGESAPVIAARERLDLGVGTLHNREEALIFSAGDLTIGDRLDGDGQAIGRANRVHNASATIEALGDLSISAASLRNTNEQFDTQLELSQAESGQGIYIQPTGWDEKRPADEFRNERWGGLYHEPTGLVIGIEGMSNELSGWTGRRTSWREYEIERSVYASAVTRSSPGSITAGGDLHLTGNDLINDKSRIVAGGDLSGDLDNVVNREATGERLVAENGRVRSIGWDGHYEEGARWTTPFITSWEEYSHQETLGDMVLPITEFGGGQTISGSGTQLGALQTATISGAASGAGAARADVGTVESNSGIIEVPALSATGRAIDAPRRAGDLTLADGTAIERQAWSDWPGAEVIRTLMPRIQLPVNRLFRLDPAPTAAFLVETDPRFTDRRQWLSSDYLLEALEHDPAMTHKRLGDGFYEQRLIREQILQLTGQRFLGDHRNDDAQYRALMNAGLTFAEAHDLRPGVALTAAQMAQLTSDIVWLVEQTVTLDDSGTVKVLVPQVYARLREGDLTGDGTLIAGNVLDLNLTGDLLNTGTLTGRELVQIDADTLTNLGGRISGHRVDLSARTDLTNLGGEITANESLTLTAGRDLTLASTAERLAGLYVTNPDGQLLAGAGRDLMLRGAEVDSAGRLQLTAGRDLAIASTLSREQRRYGRYTTARTELERTATLTAGRDLVLGAGRDLSLTAAEVSSEGRGLLSAGRDLTLDTLETRDDRHLGRNTTRHHEEVGTRLEIADDLGLLAGQDLSARAAQVESGGDLTALAGRDLRLEAGLRSAYAERRGGGTHTIDRQTRVVGSEFVAEGDLRLGAGQDLSLIASRAQAGGEATLSAGRDLALLSAQEEDYSLFEKTSGGGLFGSQRYQRDEVHDSRAVGSELASGGDLTLASGGDQTYQAARLAAGDDLTLASGGAIAFDTASDVHTEAHERSKSNFAWQSAKGRGETVETLRQSELVAQGELAIRAAEGIRIEVPELDEQSVSQTIAALAEADPGLAWLQEMEQRSDVDWQQVKAIHDEWAYSESGLSEGTALAVSIIAAAAGQHYVGAMLGSGVTAGAASAAAGSLAGSGAVNLINNEGDLGAALDDTFSSDGLRSAALAAASAGLARGVTDRLWQTDTHLITDATRGLDLGQLSDIGTFAGQRATQATLDAGLRSALDGGSFEDHLGDGFEDALTHVVSGVLFHAVGDQAQTHDWAEGSPEKVALHSLVGGSVAEALGGDFKSGALAAGASEALADTLVEDAQANPVLSHTMTQLVGIVAAELTDGDVNDGALIAGQVESYNRQLHSRERNLARELAERSDGEHTVGEIEQALRGMYHDELGQSPGDDVVVDLQDLDAVDGTYFDYGGDWLATAGVDGTTRYLVQLVPTDTPPKLIAYIIEQTGGEDSPYRAPEARPPVPRPEPELHFPGSIAMAAGLPYNLNEPDTRSEAQLERDQQAFTRGMASMAALPITGSYAAATLTARGALGLFATGAGFDAVGQYVQGGEYRFGQTLAAGTTAMLYGPLVGRSLWGNAAVGGAAGGSLTTVTNWVYDENKSIVRSVGMGAAAGGVGTRIGESIKGLGPYIPSQVTLPYFYTPATYSVTLPSEDVMGDVAETIISNMPAFLPLPDADTGEQP